jgi:hypothetical protein
MVAAASIIYVSSWPKMALSGITKQHEPPCEIKRKSGVLKQ